MDGLRWGNPGWILLVVIWVLFEGRLGSYMTVYEGLGLKLRVSGFSIEGFD